MEVKPMNKILQNLAIQSFCFRAYKKHDQVIDALRQCGLDKIELCGVHVDPIHGSASELEQAIGKYRDSGIQMTAFGVHVLTRSEKDNRKIFAFAKQAGMDMITCHFDPGSLPIVEKLCEEYGIRAALHNHGRTHYHGSVWAIEEFFQTASSRIGLCLDTAWMIDMQQDPVKVAEKFRDRLFGIHLKDFVYNRAGRPEDIMLGEGNLNLKAFLKYLKESDYDGYYTLEYEGDVDNPIPSIQACKRIVEEVSAELT
jgi:inosose dehydratase